MIYKQLSLLQKEMDQSIFQHCSLSLIYTFLLGNRSLSLKSARTQSGDITYRTTMVPANWGGFSPSRASSPSREAYRKMLQHWERTHAFIVDASLATPPLCPFPLQPARTHTHTQRTQRRQHNHAQQKSISDY